MIEAKIHLSPNEMELVTNAEWILTKNGIMEKARWLLEDLQLQMKTYLANNAGLGDTTVYGSPKISRGENYQGLPYLVLDYPRVFNKSNILAIRTMFWWGKFFSTTLHLAGHYKELSERKIVSGVDILKHHNFYLCTNEVEWEHHFETSNYVPVIDLTQDEFMKMTRGKPFIKIAKKLALHQWNDAGEVLFNNFRLLADLMTVNFPGDEKVL